MSPGGGNLGNAFFGVNAGHNNLDCCNAFFGNFAGESNTTGGVNTFLGRYAGSANTQGSYNTFVGSGAGNSNTTGFSNTFVGGAAGLSNTTGWNNTAIGRNADGGTLPPGYTGNPGDFNTFVGTSTSATQDTFTFATAIGAGAVVDGSYKIVLGRPTDTVSVPGTFTNPSDARLKIGITNLHYGLSEVLRLRPVTWTWKDRPDGRAALGLVAQDVQPILPELVIQGSDKDQMLSMNYLGLLPVVIRAIQEQQETITSLRKEVAALQTQNTNLANKSMARPPADLGGMMNIYTGNVTTDESGKATIKLPDYFEALNRDFRYQLTVIGQFAQAIVSTEISNNRFTIQTDKPQVRVSWQVTGIRQDAYANDHRIPGEEEKTISQRGSYLYPDGYASTKPALASANRGLGGHRGIRSDKASITDIDIRRSWILLGDPTIRLK